MVFEYEQVECSLHVNDVFILFFSYKKINKLQTYLAYIIDYWNVSCTYGDF